MTIFSYLLNARHFTYIIFNIQNNFVWWYTNEEHYFSPTELQAVRSKGQF